MWTSTPSSANARVYSVPGGILAIHENGANNPVIKLGRVFRRRSAEHSPAVRRYLTTISGYYEPDRNCCAGFRCIFRNEYFLFSPASFVLELKGFSRSARMVELVTVPLDQFWADPRWSSQ